MNDEETHRDAGGKHRFRWGGRTVRLAVALVVAAVPFLVAAPAAFAGTGLGVTADFPTPLSVGQTNVPGSITFMNTSTGTQASENLTLGAIHLVPSCGLAGGSGNCPTGGHDTGVFSINSSVTGAAGTACAGISFTVTQNNATTGQLKFTPSTNIVLGPTSSASALCTINFTFNVLKDPAVDFSSAAAGLQTEQIAMASGTATDGSTASGIGTNVVTVNDPTVPSCTLTSSTVGPPAQIQVTVQDTGSGLAAPPNGIVVTELNNATDTIGSYSSGTTTPVVITATKVDSTQPSQLGLSIIDRSGNVTTCDPTAVSVASGHAQTVRQVPRSEHFLTVFNSRPGLSSLVAVVNGHQFTVQLTSGQTATVNLASAMKAGTNAVELAPVGGAGATASVVLHD